MKTKRISKDTLDQIHDVIMKPFNDGVEEVGDKLARLIEQTQLEVIPRADIDRIKALPDDLINYQTNYRISLTYGDLVYDSFDIGGSARIICYPRIKSTSDIFRKACDTSKQRIVDMIHVLETVRKTQKLVKSKLSCVLPSLNTNVKLNNEFPEGYAVYQKLIGEVKDPEFKGPESRCDQVENLRALISSNAAQK